MPDRYHDPDLELSRVWNELTETGARTLTDLDPETVGLVHRLHASANAPLPGSARERVWRGLIPPHVDHPSVEAPPPAEMPFSANGHARLVHLPMPVRRRRHSIDMPLAYVLAAVLIVAIVGGISGAILADRWRLDDGAHPPAILAPGSPEAANETLVELTLPVELLPSGSQLLATFRLATAAADSRTSLAADPCCPGPQVIYVLAGSYTAQAMYGTLTVYRAGGAQPESIARETDVTLGPGDLALAAKGVNLLLVNQTETPVQLLVWRLTTNSLSMPSPQNDIPIGWSVDVNVYQLEVSLPPGALILRLQRVALEPGDVVEPPPRAFSQALKSGGSGAFMRRDDNALTNPGTKPVSLYLLSLTPIEPDEAPSSVGANDP